MRKNDRIWGLEEFSIQKPIARNYTYEYLFHKFLEETGHLNLKYFFVNLYINDENKKKKAFNKIIQFSVDTLNVNLNGTLNLKGKELLGNKFDYQFYDRSRFYGISLFFKILIVLRFSKKPCL